MTWTGVLIFWLLVAVGVLSAKNIWLRFTIDSLKQWQGRAMLAIARSLQTPQREETEDDVLDSDVIQ